MEVTAPDRRGVAASLRLEDVRDRSEEAREECARLLALAGTVTVLAPLSLRIDAVISLGGAGVDLAPAAFGLTLAFAVGVWLRWLGATKEVAHLDAALLTSEHILQASHRPGLLRGPLVYPQPPRMPSER